MLHPVPLEDPKLLAFFLASYARDAKARIDLQASLPALDSVKAALEKSLGLSFVGTEGEAFFRSTLVQTLFYTMAEIYVEGKKGQKAINEFEKKFSQCWNLEKMSIPPEMSLMGPDAENYLADMMNLKLWEITTLKEEQDKLKKTMK